MTKYILSKKVITNKLTHQVYKLIIFMYSVYITFSAQAFALSAEAPLGGQSFKAIVFDETVSLEQERIKDLKIKEEKIRAYYARYDLPLQHEAEHFVVAAEKYGIDWRLVAAIGFIESTGGKFSCKTAKYSAFGWGSCKIDFESYAESIDVISKNLGGFNPNTAEYYKEKTIPEILEAYNPDHIRPGYAEMVMNQMEVIEN